MRGRGFTGVGGGAVVEAVVETLENNYVALSTGCMLGGVRPLFLHSSGICTVCNRGLYFC